MSKIKVIDLFAGIGGLSYGFYHSDKFKIVAANEILPDMCQTYRKNHPGVQVFEMDIANFNRGLISESVDVNDTTVDVIIGGPPCQAYSTVGKRLLDDERGKLFQEYYRILKEFNPKIFIYENVKGLLSMQGGKLINQIIDLFSSLGYEVKFEVLNAADYGVPQLRERVIMVGSKISDSFEYPSKTHNMRGVGGLQKWVTLDQAIGDLPVLTAGSKATEYTSDPYTKYQEEIRNGSKILHDHEAPNNGKKLLKLMSYIPEGGGPKDIPEKMRPKSGFGNTYSRLRSQRPGMTITRNLGTPSSSRCIHPSQDRPLTTREGARIQSFPDTFLLTGSRSSKNLQLGNAVPPILSHHLSRSVLKHLEND